MLQQEEFQQLLSPMLQQWKSIVSDYDSLPIDACLNGDLSPCKNLEVRTQDSIDHFLYNYRDATEGGNSREISLKNSSDYLKMEAFKILLRKHNIILRLGTYYKGGYEYTFPVLLPIIFKGSATITENQVNVRIDHDPVNKACSHYKDTFNTLLVEDNFKEFALLSGGLPRLYSNRAAELDFVSVNADCGYTEIFPRPKEVGYAIGKNIVSIIDGTQEGNIRQNLSLEDVVAHELLHVYFNYWFADTGKNQSKTLKMHEKGYSTEVTYFELEETYANLQSSFYEVKKLFPGSEKEFMERMKKAHFAVDSHYGMVKDAHARVWERYEEVDYSVQYEGKTMAEVETERRGLLLSSMVQEASLVKNYLLDRK